MTIIKVQIDDFLKGEIDAVYLAYTRFVNTMTQTPVVEQLLPLPEGAPASASPCSVSSPPSQAACFSSSGLSCVGSRPVPGRRISSIRMVWVAGRSA